MSEGSAHGKSGSGDDRLLHDCAVVGRVLVSDRPSAAERCEAALGAPLVALLRSALTGDNALTRGLAVGRASIAPVLTLVAVPSGSECRPGEPAILRSRPVRPTAVSPGTGRNDKRRVVSTLGASRTRVMRATQNKQLASEQRSFGSWGAVVELACECGDEACAERVLLTDDELTFLASVRSYYAVCPEHVKRDDHVLVGEPGRLAIVE
jgi:hypothetical protein